MKHPPLKGFTLIELLIVIAIIGILAGILFVSIGQEPLKKARDSKALSDVNQIIQALELARTNSSDGKYPSDGSTGAWVWTCLKPGGNCWRGTYSGGAPEVATLSPTYLAAIPKPPAGGDASCYIYDAYLYSSSANYYNNGLWNGAKSAYIIYAKEHPFSPGECDGPSNFNAGSYDCGLYYCYKFIGYN